MWDDCVLQLDRQQFEVMWCILHNNGSIVLGNNERIVVPDSLRFIWEVRCFSFLWSLFHSTARTVRLHSYYGHGYVESRHAVTNLSFPVHAMKIVLRVCQIHVDL